MYEKATDRYEEGLKAIKKGITKKGGTKSRDAVNKRIGKLDLKYGAIRKAFDVELKYKETGKKEQVEEMTWTRLQGKDDTLHKLHGKYVLVTSIDEQQEENIWKFYNVIRTVEETFHVLKTDLDIRPVYHKSDDGIKAHLNLAVLAYWIVSVTKHRLKIKGYENVRWDEILRIANTQVVVTAKVNTTEGDVIQIRQCTEAEAALADIHVRLCINQTPLPKVKSVVLPKTAQKNPHPDN